MVMTGDMNCTSPNVPLCITWTDTGQMQEISPLSISLGCPYVRKGHRFPSVILATFRNCGAKKDSQS